MAIVKVNFTTNLDRAAKSVRYHAFRSRESPADRKGLFDGTSDHADVRRFIEVLDDPLTRDRTTRRGRRITPAKMYRVVISPRRSEYEACRFSTLKPLIREAMQTFEAQQGIRLDWVAAEHLSGTHPHAHVDIKAVYTTPGGGRFWLVLRKDQIIALRQIVGRIMERELSRAREERRQEREADRAIRDLTQGLSRLIQQAGRDEPDHMRPTPRKPRRQDRDREDRGPDR